MTEPGPAWAGQRLVVDASVALKWLVDDEEDADAALALQGLDLVAPSLMRVEVANALRSMAAHGRMTLEHALAQLALLGEAPVAILEADDTADRRALHLALDLGHPVYDCVYLALAERTSRTLITADARFLRALAGTPHAARAVALA